MIKYDYFRGHQIFFDGRFFVARHDNTELRALTRKGIELLIAGASREMSLLDVAEYHITRAIELCIAELGKNPQGDEENALLIQLKRTHALLIQTQWKLSK